MALTTAQAQAQCAAQQLGPNACAELVAPTCAPGQGVRIEEGRVPFCVNEDISPAKARALLAEAQQRQAELVASHAIRFVAIVGAGLAGAGLLYFALR